MDDPTGRDLDALTADPERLDGHTVDELADYLDRGRTPLDPSIEASPACRHAMAALLRLRALSDEMLADRPPTEEADPWVARVLAGIAADAHAGADVPVGTTEAGDELVITEGALRALVRAAGDDRPGSLVGGVRLAGDLTGRDGDAVLTVDVVVAHGVRIPEEAAALRRAVLEQLRRHTLLRHPRIDVVVRDVTTEER